VVYRLSFVVGKAKGERLKAKGDRIVEVGLSLRMARDEKP
jgi:hypothetical protein